MRLGRALLISLGITLALMAVFWLVFGIPLYGVFLLLPLGFVLSQSRKRDVVDDETRGNDPINPK